MATLAETRPKLKRKWPNFGDGDVTNLIEHDPTRLRGGSKPNHSVGMMQRVNKKQNNEFKKANAETRSKIGIFYLPAEIRNPIYELALISKYRIDFDRRNNDATNPHKLVPLGLTPNLLQTCKAVYKEAI